MQLSSRLSAVASLVTAGYRIADVGTDHGYIPIYLVEKGIVPKAIALDVNQGPLKRAGEHIKEHHLEAYIETRLSDGAAALFPGEVDTLIAAGMGGALVIKILTEGHQVLSDVKELILQPQSELFLVRKYLQSAGYQITDEDMVLEDGKFYPMMRAVHGQAQEERDIYLKFGKLLLEEKNPILKQFLMKEIKTLQKVRQHLLGTDASHIVKRRLEVDAELYAIKEALCLYG